VSWPSRIGIFLIRAYRVALGPFMGGACRFDPSCSAYAIGALEAHGVLRGTWLALRRVVRCHPFAQPGLDPVPPRVSGR
jgi:uncharacterized protein